MTSLSTRLTATRPSWQPWLVTAARLFLAGVFIWAGWPKFLDVEGTVRSVRAFEILPEAFVRPFAYGLPMLELVLAALLVLGLGTRLAGAATAVLMLVFIGGIGWAWARGLSINCGCFGNAGDPVANPVPGYIKDIVRDLLFLGAAILVTLSPRSRFALDGLLGLHPPAARTSTPGSAPAKNSTPTKPKTRSSK